MARRGDGSRIAIVVLGAAAAALALLNWHVAQAPVDISAIAPEARRVGEVQKSNAALTTPLDKKPLLQFRETVHRPLFNADRRPVTRDQHVAKETKAGPGSMRLIGVMKLDDAPARALIRMTSGAPGKWIAEGDQFDGWKLRRVTARSVIVESGGRSHELTLQSVRGSTDDEPSGPDSDSQPR